MSREQDQPIAPSGASCVTDVKGGVRTAERERPVAETAADTRLEDWYQVILYNDDHNTMDHVVRCLMQVFGHTEALAVKIMVEAHERGKAIAEVEAETPARLHHDQLTSFGLSAAISKF
jgi:ATP-dependent Clp protease adaptor protein ClpS